MSDDAIMLKDVISPQTWYKRSNTSQTNPSRDLKTNSKVEQKCKESKIIKTTVCAISRANSTRLKNFLYSWQSKKEEVMTKGKKINRKKQAFQKETHMDNWLFLQRNKGTTGWGKDSLLTTHAATTDNQYANKKSWSML